MILTNRKNWLTSDGVPVSDIFDNFSSSFISAEYGISTDIY